MKVADVAVTMDDVAARAGVSRAAVSLALRNSPKVSSARREQILQVAAELGYRPNINASRLARARTGTIGVVFSDLHNALYAEMLDGLAGRCATDPSSSSWRPVSTIPAGSGPRSTGSWRTASTGWPCSALNFRPGRFSSWRQRSRPSSPVAASMASTG